MPLNAEPLVEFASSHRLMWVQSMAKGNKLQAIGTGIIGSSDEEKSRKDLDWEEGSMYLVLSNGGKAIGWVHTNNSKSPASEVKDDAQDKASGHAVLQIVKLPAEKLLSTDNDEPETAEEEEPNWVSVFLRFCLTGFIEIANSTNERYYKFSEEEYSALKIAFQRAAQEKKGALTSPSILPDPKLDDSATRNSPSGQ